MKKGGWSDEFVHHWKYYLATARASPSDLDFLKEKIMEKGKSCSVLILGSAPEYRNLCGQLGIKATIIDFRKYNYEYLGKEVRKKSRECFFEADWLSAPLGKKFDIILGDNVINVISKKHTLILLHNISEMLRDDGLFLPRSYVRDNAEHYTPEKIISEYRGRKQCLSLYTATNRGLYLAAYDFKLDRLFLKDV